jgi:hypothetical protein
VTTRGTGFNVLPKMYMVNDRQGPKIFGYIDGLLRGNIARYHGQGSD